MNKWQNIRSADLFQTPTNCDSEILLQPVFEDPAFLLAPGTNYTKWQHNGTASVCQSHTLNHPMGMMKSGFGVEVGDYNGTHHNPYFIHS